MIRILSPYLALTALAFALAGCTLPRPPMEGSPSGRERALLEQQQQDLARRMERMEGSVQELRDRLQEQQQRIEELQETLVAQKGTPAGEKAAPAEPVAGLENARSRENLSPTKIYLQAFADYASGRFPDAIAGFGTFLQVYPGNDYAANAQYWLAECYFSQQQYDRATEEFAKVVEHYPQGSKAPDALLKMAQALQSMNETEKARQALQTLRGLYPESSAARKSLKND